LGAVEILWRMSIPELFGLADAGLDDADVDRDCNLYVSDGMNGRVYKLQPDGEFDTFSVIRMRASEAGEGSLNLAVASDSSFCVADADGGSVIRYNERGEHLGEFPAPGILSLCQGHEGLLYVLSSVEGAEQINIYDQLGIPIETLPAPVRHRARLDPGLVNLDCDRDGNVYVSYGMPPYRIWKVSGSEIETWSRGMDHPEDAVLIADIAVDSDAGVLWSLLARKESGRQMLDAFSLDGEFLGTTLIPHSRSLYGVICATGGSELYLLDTSSGPGAGEVLRLLVSV